MATTPEGKVLAACVTHLRQLKKDGMPIEWKKVHGSGMSRRGEPDLDVVVCGHAMKIEIKAGANDTTPMQEHRLSQWATAGATVGVIHSVNELDAIVRAALKWAKRKDGV
jgi:hypothetical protein